MQISNNHSCNIYYPRGNSFRAENPKEQESSKTYGEILDEAIQKENQENGHRHSKIWQQNFNAAVSEATQLFGEVNFYDAMKVLNMWRAETNPSKIESLVSKNISQLEIKQNNESRLDEFGNLNPTPQHIFEAEKSKAVDILSEILQGIKG
ncbi:MAG: hypothetical protein K2N75_00915 [Helicobacter sp.]|uniref:hypothetical protein n=1 Tax=Helicobacter sp. TaxID=218 RepID=UPI0023D13489|nr:hypothetical protein [Helicobacter sp.]MDE5926790.1 hypothetical protein [Helicobacter sp.]MDE7174599.1 hypothetical protein [Helicobacter sp.]